MRLALVLLVACAHGPTLEFRRAALHMRNRPSPLLPPNAVGHAAVLTTCAECEPVSASLPELIVVDDEDALHGVPYVVVDENGIVRFAGTREMVATQLHYREQEEACGGDED